MAKDDRQPVLIEQTSKRYKAIQLAGGIVIICSIALAVAISLAFRNGETPAVITCIVGCMLGVALVVLGGTLAWWYHG